LVQIELMLLVIDVSLLGAALGAFTGIAPGIHVNTLATGVLMAYPLLEGAMAPLLGTFGADPGLTPVFLACLLISASVVHSFLDFIPSVFFGAPEESESLSVLPGHRMLLAGRGMDAVAIAAGGSFIGAAAAIVASLPLIVIFVERPDVIENIDPFIPGLLLTATAVVLMSQRDGQEAEWVIRVGRSSEKNVSLLKPVPIDGRSVSVSGRVEGLWPRRTLKTDHGTWRMNGYRGPSGRSVTVDGTWKIVRKRWRPKASVLLAFLLSGAIGFTVMNGRVPGGNIFGGLDGNLLLPMLTGLFSVPSLLESSSGTRIPEQDTDARTRADVRSSIRGVGAGLFAAWVPGVTSTAGTVLGTTLDARKDEETESSTERFISMSASVGTAATIFGIAALVMTGSGGTGVLVAVDEMMASTEMSTDADLRLGFVSLLMLSALVSSVLGYFLTIWCGRVLARHMSERDSSSSSLAILIFETVLVLAFTGVPGLMVLTVSSVVGCFPPAAGVGRVSLTGCLVLPIILSYCGMDLLIAGFIG